MAALDVFLEVGKRRTFASAADWPGWARAGRTPDLALGELLRGVRRVPAGPELRREIIEALRVESAVAAGWPPAYFVRRSVWHALDHAWEIEDRSSLTPRSALSTDV